MRKNLDRAELIIKALCDTDYTDEMLKSFSAQACEKLESEFFNPSSKKLVNFLEKMVSGLTKVLKSVGKLKSPLEKYRGYENKVNEYITISRKEGISKATEQTRTAFNEFKDLYQSLGDIDIFQGFITIPEWPKGDIWNTPRKQ